MVIVASGDKQGNNRRIIRMERIELQRKRGEEEGEGVEILTLVIIGGC